MIVYFPDLEVLRAVPFTVSESARIAGKSAIAIASCIPDRDNSDNRYLEGAFWLLES